jgi:hypothetical protein
MTYTDVLELGRGRRVAPEAQTMNGAAIALAYLGAAPLLAAALLVVQGGALAEIAASLMTLYGAMLIVFFGGVRWGVAVMKPGGPTPRALVGAIIPLLVAAPLFLPGDWMLKTLAIMGVLLLLLVDDLGATRRGDGAPAWYLGVRAPLTVLIEIAFLMALAARVGQ